jgi:hypothetical protein
VPKRITPSQFRALTEKIIRPLPFSERLAVLSALASGQPVRPLLVENEDNLVFGRLLDRLTTSGVLDERQRQAEGRPRIRRCHGNSGAKTREPTAARGTECLCIGAR